MIYATIKPIEEYNVVDPTHGTFGIHESYKDTPALLALVMLGTLIGFDYEGAKPPLKRQVNFNDDVLLEIRKSLEFEIAGISLEGYLQTLNPIEFHCIIKDEDLSELPIVKEIYKGNQEVFKNIVGVRAAAWGLNFRGKVSSEGNVTQVAFGKKSTVDVPEDMAELYTSMKERLINGQ